MNTLKPLLLATVCLPLFVACGDDGGGQPVADTSVAADTVDGDTAAPTDTGATDTGPTDATTADDTAQVTDTTPLPPAPTAETWCGQWADAWCGARTRCGLPGHVSEAACKRAELDACFQAALPGAVAAGALAFDAADAKTCVDTLRSMGCADLAEAVTTSLVAIPACGDAVTGLTAVGGDCALGTECVAGAFCDIGAACPGTCVAFAGIGDDCDPLTWCDFDSAACVGGECVAPPATVGAACSGRCAAPLACNGVTDTCVAPGLAGDPCGADGNVCVTGLTCFRPNTSATGTCSPLGGVGADCFSSGDCRAATSGETLACIGGACAVAPGAGQPCFEFSCSGAWCDTSAVPPTCVALPAAGSACGGGNACAVGAWCDAGTCAQRKGAGASCTSPAHCESGRCFGGACVATGAPPCGG
ncbi:MAG: hypothetical protein CVU56_22945 [Deltaproteobacteria bacterium HGW-Deltaproteobacteria-14]|jgi:hypothetical protein|nr:MAG: hypothetical protein CVU56_22945 [Deltaproteobacteria bacterium HGW-Deltaproteobacteria-14]